MNRIVKIVSLTMCATVAVGVYSAFYFLVALTMPHSDKWLLPTLKWEWWIGVVAFIMVWFYRVFLIAVK